MQYALQISQRLKKMIKSLHQKQFRDETGLFLCEGEKICTELLHSDFQTELIVVKDNPTPDVLAITESFAERATPVYTAPKAHFDQMCDTKSPQSIIAVAAQKECKLNGGMPFIVLDGIADPGNMGTIIRTADWFGFRQVILGANSCDIYNPKAVRSTMGSIFRTDVVYSEDLISTIRDTFPGHELFGASLDATSEISKISPAGSFGIVFGSESHGLTEEIKSVLTHEYLIEGKGHAESLNVSIAAGISLHYFSKFI